MRVFIAAFGILLVACGPDQAAALEARGRDLERRGTEMDQRTSALDARRAALDAREKDLDARERELSSRKAALDATQQTIDAANAKLRQDRAAFEAEKASFARDYCTVYVAGHDANVTLWGSGFNAACAEIERWMQSNRVPTRLGDPSSAGTVCRGSKGATLWEVRDTGGLYFGKQMCDAFIRWSQGVALTTLTIRSF